MAAFKSILLTEEAWMNSHLSVAKYAGGVSVTGENGEKHILLIVNKDGKDLTQTGIPPGEPADLVDKEFIPLYKKLGRDKFIEVVNANNLLSRQGLKKVLIDAADKLKKEKETEKAKKKAELEKQYQPLDFQ